MMVLQGKNLAEVVEDINAGKWEKPSIELLDFYEKGDLVILERDGSAIAFVAVGFGDIFKGRKWYYMDGTTQDIAQANDLAGLNLTEENVLSYLGFYCRMLKIKDNTHRLYITDEYNGEVPGAASARIDEVTDDGRFLCSATVRHPDALYAARFEVQEHGDVDVIEETLLGTIEAGH